MTLFSLRVSEEQCQSLGGFHMSARRGESIAVRLLYTLGGTRPWRGTSLNRIDAPVSLGKSESIKEEHHRGFVLRPDISEVIRSKTNKQKKKITQKNVPK